MTTRTSGQIKLSEKKHKHGEATTQGMKEWERKRHCTPTSGMRKATTYALDFQWYVKRPRLCALVVITPLMCIPNTLYGVGLKIATARSDIDNMASFTTKETPEMLKCVCRYPTTLYKDISLSYTTF